ncbi:MAG TPA: acyl-ACP--UDP-N-acetylglucosamine O-acyltransferase [Oligoflexia bacterium]|nr:acyl-ACP--UDP-N-acetylglucosamine O-acyltransferase [Oligoflexia bacterium]HMP47075.1 acyl-ACP--UDP-N-acetylglucosamine O-acyltransferase [Oligoflexia bacterium]
MSFTVHGTAIVAEGADIGQDVFIGPYCVVGQNVKIGKGTKLHSHVIIDGYTSLGEYNELFPFASIGTVPQDLKFKGEPSTLTIGDRNKIREYVTIQPGTEHGGMKTVVGSSNLFMANCHIGHDSSVGSSNVFANSVAIAGHVRVENNIIFGGLSAVHQFCRIGSLSLVAGGAMVNLDVPPFCLVQGDRASLRGLNLIGLQRAGFSPEDISCLKRVYRHLFFAVGHFRKKLETIPNDLIENERVKALLDFINGSSRGITEPLRSSNDMSIVESFEPSSKTAVPGEVSLENS